jgi:ribosomal protein S19E (S16A)
LPRLKESEHKYVPVWARFGKTTKKAETEMRDWWIDLVAGLVEYLKGRSEPAREYVGVAYVTSTASHLY